jgi:hypothetical protein
MPWWAIALLCLACLLAGGLVVYLVMIWYLARVLRD